VNGTLLRHAEELIALRTADHRRIVTVSPRQNGCLNSIRDRARTMDAMMIPMPTRFSFAPIVILPVGFPHNSCCCAEMPAKEIADVANLNAATQSR
jgi:hypothetical protein